MELTEIQKQLKANILNPEVRDGIYVSAELKKIWKVELAILEEFIDICEKYNLKWFAIAGTLIGAARHKGFIPWDDDIDVAMPRPDYERFLKVVQDELKYPYELSNAQVDPHRFYAGISRICNSETTAISDFMVKKGLRYNFGIFIDIIPLDGVVPNRKLFSLLSKLLWCIKAIEWTRCSHIRDCNGFLSKLRCAFRKLFWLIAPQSWLMAIKNYLYTRKNYGETEMCGAIAINYLERDTWRHEFSAETVKLPFEYLQINCPSRYDEFLTARYGDWKTMKPQEVCHEFLFDPDKSYKDVLREKYEN